jgi:multidrug efflux pump subunit AcrA (membrane-fusion protein)
LRPPVRTRARPRRLWWIRPRSVLAIIAVAIFGWFILDRSWIRGNGIIAGELTAESPIVQARLERLFVKCLDHVSKGQRLAEFYNEAMVQLAGQELQQLQFQLAQARAEIEIADREAQAAQKLTDAQNALLQQQVAVLQAESNSKSRISSPIWSGSRRKRLSTAPTPRPARPSSSTKQSGPIRRWLRSASMCCRNGSTAT